MVNRTAANRRIGNKNSIGKNQMRRKRRKLAYDNREPKQAIKATIVKNAHPWGYLRIHSPSNHLRIIPPSRIEGLRRVQEPIHPGEKELTIQEKLNIIDELYGSMDEYTAEGVLETFRIASREDWEEKTN